MAELGDRSVEPSRSPPPITILITFDARKADKDEAETTTATNTQEDGEEATEKERAIRKDRAVVSEARNNDETKGSDLRGQFTRVKWVINVIMAKL